MTAIADKMADYRKDAKTDFGMKVFNFVADHPGSVYSDLAEHFYPGQPSNAGHQIYRWLRGLVEDGLLRKERAMNEEDRIYHRYYVSDGLEDKRFDNLESFDPREAHSRKSKKAWKTRQAKSNASKPTKRFEVEEPKYEEEIVIEEVPAKSTPSSFFGVERLLAESARLDLEGKTLFLENQRKLKRLLDRVERFFGASFEEKSS